MSTEAAQIRVAVHAVGHMSKTQMKKFLLALPPAAQNRLLSVILTDEERQRIYDEYHTS